MSSPCRGNSIWMLSFVRRKELNRNRFKCRQSTWGRGGRWWGEGRRREGQREGKGKKGGREWGREEGGEGEKKERRERRNKQTGEAVMFTVSHSLHADYWGASFHIRTNYQRPWDNTTFQPYMYTYTSLRAEATSNPRVISEILNIHKLLAF